MQVKDFYYRKLKVYHQSKQLVTNIYSLTRRFPLHEQYGLSNQIQRDAISIPSNIAEGMGRFSLKERIHFLEIAYGSLMEVMCQLEIAEQLNYITSDNLTEQENLVSEIASMLIGLRKTIEEKNNNN
ncbi:MAG: four helix bundle protein [Prevotella sp.]|nr:four helix bundle protein [Prevotella sp.]